MTGQFVPMNGVQLWYEERGRLDGVPVVLVMGVDASSLWWPAEMVNGPVDAGCRVVLLDNRDVGLSTYIDFEQAPYTLDDMATDAICVLDAVGLDSAHFVGMSMGGVISQLAALRYPDRVRSLALLSTTPGPDERLSPPGDSIMTFDPPPAETDEEVIDGIVAFSRILAGSGYQFDEQGTRELVVADLARGMNMNSSHGFVLNATPSRVEALRGVQVPTIVIHGTEDPIFPFDHAETLARAIPGAVLVRWDGVGHDQPHEVVPELTELLVRQVGATG